MKIEDCYIGMKVVRTNRPLPGVYVGDIGTIIAFTNNDITVKIAFDGKSDEDNAIIFKGYDFRPAHFEPVEESVFSLDLSFDDLMEVI